MMCWLCDYGRHLVLLVACNNYFETKQSSPPPGGVCASPWLGKKINWLALLFSSLGFLVGVFVRLKLRGRYSMVWKTAGPELKRKGPNINNVEQLSLPSAAMLSKDVKLAASVGWYVTQG